MHLTLHKGRTVSSALLLDTILVNNTPLPSVKNISNEVAEAAGELILYVARNGIGEHTMATGMLIVIGSKRDYSNDDFGYSNSSNKFIGRHIKIQEWKSHARFILPCFTQDGALFIDGRSGDILADHYTLQLRTKDADQNGGIGHKQASAAGMKGCFAIKCSADSCSTDGKGCGNLKVFPGTKEPSLIPVMNQVESTIHEINKKV